MIINRNIPIQPVLRTQSVVQPTSNREIKPEVPEQNNSIGYVGSDPFVQQMRSASESNRTRTGLEARTEGIQKEEEYNQLFEREQNTPEVNTSTRKEVEAPPIETPVFGRKEENLVPIQVHNENEERFIPYVEYAPLSEPELDMGFYRYETEIGKLDTRDRMLMREPLEPLPPPPFRQAFAQAKDDDFSYLPAPKHEKLNEPLPAPLRLHATHTDFLNHTTTRLETDGAQPAQESAQQTIRTFDDRSKPPNILPQSLPQKQEESVLPTLPSAVPVRTEKSIEATSQIQVVNRESPVLETAAPSGPVDSYQQLEGLLSGTTQLAQEDKHIINKSQG